VLSELHGIRVKDGELVIAAVKETPAGPEFVTMPVQTAHAVGCMLIELCHLAMEREHDLRATGALLDLQAIQHEFAARVRRRQEMNSAAVDAEAFGVD
jgi:hypothetical protein